MNEKRLRGAIDNNVLISAALLPGRPRQAFDALLDNGTVLVSVPTLLELADVLNRPRFDKYLRHEERMRFLVGFLKVAEMIEIKQSVTVCRDPKDDKLLEWRSTVKLMFWCPVIKIYWF